MRLRPRHPTIATSVNVAGAEAACVHAQRFGWLVRREKVPPNEVCSSTPKVGESFL